MSNGTPFDTALAMVGEFHRAFDASKDPMLWVGLIEEETEELLESMRDGDRLNALKEAADVSYVIFGMIIVANEVGEVNLTDEQISRMDDVTARADYAAQAYRQWDPEITDENIQEAFRRVHESNMSKLGEDGKPILRDDGKVMKGPNYWKPALTDLVMAH